VSTSQKGSIELVGEFFEVRAQVDRDLTTVSWVDRLLGLIKNLGRHISVMAGWRRCSRCGLRCLSPWQRSEAVDEVRLPHRETKISGCP
jgi:hypothetical protein